MQVYIEMAWRQKLACVLELWWISCGLEKSRPNLSYTNNYNTSSDLSLELYIQERGINACGQCESTGVVFQRNLRAKEKLRKREASTTTAQNVPLLSAGLLSQMVNFNYLSTTLETSSLLTWEAPMG